MKIRFPYIASANDLVTSRGSIDEMMIALDLRCRQQSIPYLNQSKALWTKLKTSTKCCDDILALSDIKATLLLAAGYSVKAQGNMDDDDKNRLLAEFVDKVLRPYGEKYVDEIVFRYLLALGEQLGGRMRNAIGTMARERLSQQIVAHLRINAFPFSVHTGNGGWIDGSDCTPGDEAAAKTIKWQNGEYCRMLVHNLNVPDVSKNVDFVVFNKAVGNIDAKSLSPILADKKNYVVMGELKGGIDPAGADEHWKTARAALDRIRASFKKVYIAFVGAAIEKAMAEEIFTQLQSGLLDYAANLADERQLSAFCEWLINQ